MKNFLTDFENLSGQQPDHIAMVDQDGYRRTSFRELENMIDRVAAKLEGFGFPRGSFVVICMGRRTEYVAAYIGAIKAGLAVVPATPDYPAERLQYIRENCQARFTITEDFFLDLPEGRPTGKRPDLEDIVCMNYTSGSTGRPKGVYYTLRCLSESIRKAGCLYEGLTEIVTASSASMAFAAMCHDCLVPMFLGGTVHLLSDEVRKDVRRMERYFEEHHIRCANISPGILRFFGHTTGLQRVLTTGERVINIWSDQHETWCVYGLTEAFTAVSFFRIDRPYENTPIGKPLPGNLLQILDDEGNEVPDGTEGEICVTGYLAEGYFGMPEQTQDRFVQLEGGLRRFKTNDLGYKNENGDVVYVNRKDWMVKINGQRVEPYEVEAAIADVPGVTRCAVCAFTGDSGSSYLCAFYTADGTIDPRFIRDTIAKRLAPYMIPSFFVQLTSFPLTVSGKIDRKQLKPPEKDTLQSEYAPPENENEERLCRAMAKVLKLERVGRNDDFFALGGDSLKVQELLYLLDDDTLREVEVAEGRTPARIAPMMDAPELDTRRDGHWRRHAFPLTRYQQHYYRYWQFAGNITLGNTAGIYRFRKGSVSAETLARAMTAVMRHHPAFWTLISRNEAGEVTQRFDHRIVQVPKITHCTEEELRLREPELLKPFTLEDQPLYRCEIFSTPEAEHLFLDVHHIITDAGSQLVVEWDLWQTLNGGHVPVDYYCSWLAQVTAPPAEKAAACIVPDESFDRYPAFDFPEPADCNTHVITVRLKAPAQACSEQAKREGVHLQELFQAAALRAIGQYNGSDRVAVNWIYDGRDLSVKNNMVGLFLSVLPVPVDLSKAPDRASLLAQVHSVNRHNRFCGVQSPGFFGERPVLDDTLTVNYIPWMDRKGETGVEVRSIIDNNRANSNVFYVIVLEDGPGEAPLTLLFKYNSSAYQDESARKYVTLFMEALELGDYEIPGGNG